jgi:hypothetical protein
MLIDEILEIADNTSHDTILKTDGNSNKKRVCNSEWIARSRLRIDTRKYLAGKLCPKIYGDMAQEKSGNFEKALPLMSVDQKIKLFCSLPIDDRLRVLDSMITTKPALESSEDRR